jgi:indolepyruvate ferredoxin oxidoreductase beta subunit
MNAGSHSGASRVGEHVSLLIAALGGQGGGVLTDWIVEAARAEGLAVQATSTPGVSQRTGATMYYVEIAARPPAGAAPPVLGLAPVPGRVDVLVCAELLEAARMLERGMSTPSRTTVVASTHRVYTTREKMSGGDARYDSARVVDAVRALARRTVLFDMEAMRRRHGSAISAVLFGALAGSGALPMRRIACETAIRATGKGVAGSLAAFDDAFDCARAGGADARPGPAPVVVQAAAGVTAGLPARIAARVAALPPRVGEHAGEGAKAMLDYQSASYAARYLDRVERVVAAEERAARGGGTHDVSREAARALALWMSYDDVIRVASLKVRAHRLARIRSEANADANAVVRVYDFFRPGALELAAILPRGIGAWLEARAPKSEAPRRRPAPRVTLQTSSVTGALTLRLAAALRPLRPHSLRYAREQQAIAEWQDTLEEALVAGDTGAALELARLPRLIRGYGEAHAAGRANFDRVLAAYRVARIADPTNADATLRANAQAAFNDPACGPQAAAGVRSAAASFPV